MKIAKPKSGLLIGGIFTGVSIASTGTFIIPILSVLPGMIFENIAKSYVNNEPYSNVGKLTIILLASTFALALGFSLLWIYKTAKKFGRVTQRQIILIMILMYLIVHPLGYYIYWGKTLDFGGDGQTIFSAIISVPCSSVAFVLIGGLIDKIKNRYTVKIMI